MKPFLEMDCVYGMKENFVLLYMYGECARYITEAAEKAIHHHEQQQQQRWLRNFTQIENNNDKNVMSQTLAHRCVNTEHTRQSNNKTTCQRRARDSERTSERACFFRVKLKCRLF